MSAASTSGSKASSASTASRISLVLPTCPNPFPAADEAADCRSLTSPLPPPGRGKGDSGSSDIGSRYAGPAALGRDAVGGVEKQLLELARQVAAPDQARRGLQRVLLDVDGNHLVRAVAGRLIWPGLPGPDSHAVTRAGQH